MYKWPGYPGHEFGSWPKIMAQCGYDLILRKPDKPIDSLVGKPISSYSYPLL